MSSEVKTEIKLDDTKVKNLKKKRDLDEFEIRKPTMEDIHDLSVVAFESFNTWNARAGLPAEFAELDDLEGEHGLVRIVLKDMYRDPPLASALCAVEKKSNRIVAGTLCPHDDDVYACSWFFVDTDYQGSGIGPKIIKMALQEAKDKNFKSIQLCQEAASPLSFALYTNLGFEVKLLTSCFRGYLRDDVVAEIEAEAKKQGITIRQMEAKDYKECNSLYFDALQLTRLTDIARDFGHPKYVAIQDGKIVGYTTGLHLEAHNLATSTFILRALYAEAQKYYVGKSHIPNWNIPPIQNPTEVSWCLKSGLRLIRMLTLMAHSSGFFAYAKEGYIYYPSACH